MYNCFLFFSLLLAVSTPAFAQSYSWDMEWYNSLQGAENIKNNSIDPTGRRLQNPEARFATDLRINSKYNWQGGTRFVFRPRLLGDFNQYRHFNTGPASEEIKSTTTGQASLPEAYLEGEPTETIALSAGLQNYQWGPAEFISPTNSFFHFHAGQRAYHYKENGRFLLRLNWSPETHWSFITIVEPINNGDSFWIYEKKFYPKAALKIEYHGQNTFNYFGVNAGTLDDSIPFVGEYFNFEVFQGFSLYLDSRHSKGSAQYEPVQSSNGLFDMVYFKNSDPWNTLLATGIRWESQIDIRMEYIYNSYGFTQDLMAAAFQSAVAQHPRGDENLKRILGSGLELLGQHYAYISLRIPNLFVQNNNLALRYLRSLMDQSATLQLAADTAVGNSWTLFAEVNFAVGDNNQELSALEKASGLLGAKWNF